MYYLNLRLGIISFEKSVKLYRLNLVLRIVNFQKCINKTPFTEWFL